MKNTTYQNLQRLPKSNANYLDNQNESSLYLIQNQYKKIKRNDQPY